MQYPFRNIADETDEILVEASIHDGIPIGTKLEKDGRIYVRVPAVPQRVAIPTYEFISHQVDPRDDGVPHITKNGEAAFRSKKEAQDFCDRSGGSFHLEGRDKPKRLVPYEKA